MVRPEFSNKRDLTYSNWHRTLPDRCATTNIDWVEVRDNKIVAIIEDKDIRAKGIRIWQARIMQQIATALKVPFYVVFHNCATKPENDWIFQVLNFQTKQSTKMNKEQYMNFLISLR